MKLPNGKYRYFYDQDEYNAYLRRLEYQSNMPDFMKNLPLIDENTVMSSDENMAEVNEDYDPWEADRSMNCAYCTTAYELRMRGFDVQASEYDAEKYDAYLWNIDKWFEDGDMQYISPSGKSIDINKYTDSRWGFIRRRVYDKVFAKDDDQEYSASNVKKTIEANNPPNSRGNLIVNWSGGGAHSMVYEVDSNGNATIRDTQVNDTYTFDELIDMGVKDVIYMRTDNLEFSKRGMHVIERN